MEGGRGGGLFFFHDFPSFLVLCAAPFCLVQCFRGSIEVCLDPAPKQDLKVSLVRKLGGVIKDVMKPFLSYRAVAVCATDYERNTLIKYIKE